MSVLRATFCGLNVLEVFEGSNGNATSLLYAKLLTLGPAGEMAMNLFRACKNSGRAKDYRKREHKDAAYGRKLYSLQCLCKVLEEHAAGLGIEWGWKIDPKQEFFPWVLYCEIPTGQVSFHNAERLSEKDYPGEWDQTTHSPARIIRWTTQLLQQSCQN